MTTHLDIIKQAKKKDGNLFSMNQKSEVFVHQMKILNVMLLEKIPGFKLGIPFFPDSRLLTIRLSEAYINEGRVGDIEQAFGQASKDAGTIAAAIKELLG